MQTVGERKSVFEPRFFELRLGGAGLYAQLGELFKKLGEPSPEGVEGDYCMGVGAPSLGIFVFFVSRGNSQLPPHERYPTDFYHYAAHMEKKYGGPILVLVGGINDAKLQVLDFSQSPGSPNRLAWGLTVKAYDVVGWARSKRGKVGPVIDMVNAPAGCIQRADVAEWFEIAKRTNELLEELNDTSLLH